MTSQTFLKEQPSTHVQMCVKQETNMIKNLSIMSLSYLSYICFVQLNLYNYFSYKINTYYWKLKSSLPPPFPPDSSPIEDTTEPLNLSDLSKKTDVAANTGIRCNVAN